MCGILAVVSRNQDASAVIVEGLLRLEYRGYDSAGLAIASSAGVEIRRALGAVSQLCSLQLPTGRVGIGHTRWATHGKPSERNAHPHSDCTGRIAVVHNGIVENYLELREKLAANGHIFTSETDTEVISHLIEDKFTGDLLAAVRAAASLLEGSYALAVVSADAPERVVAARHKSPLLVGLADGRTLLASDAMAIISHTRRVVYLKDRETAEITSEGVMIYDAHGVLRATEPTELDGSVEEAKKDGFEHFMLKEIYDIPQSLRSLLHGRIGLLGTRFDVEGELSEEMIRNARRIVIVACGTSYYSGVTGKTIIEALADVPVEVQLASEFRYARLVGAQGTLVIGVSQSGETADTLEALRMARAAGCSTLAIVNVHGSTLAREADGAFYLRAGPEIGVASTKAFVNALGALYLLGIHLGQVNGRINPTQAQSLAASLTALPTLALRTIDRADEIRVVGEEFFSGASDAFFLGRQLMHGIALEGALKLKEISYVHAEGYAGGELKHGPLALLSAGLPVTALLSPHDNTHGVMLSNIVEVQARGAKVLGILCDSDARAGLVVDRVIRLPASDPYFYPFPACIALYLLAYHAARARGCPIDKPRNLAKSVTVE